MAAGLKSSDKGGNGGGRTHTEEIVEDDTVNEPEKLSDFINSNAGGTSLPNHHVSMGQTGSEGGGQGEISAVFIA